MKYIIFKDFAGEAIPVIFPERISFTEMREQIPYPAVLSAGRVSLDQGMITCSGQSSELGFKAMASDSQVIEKHLKT